MTNNRIYAEPLEVASIDECYFYHTIDLPGHGTIHGAWDLREHLDDYLGFVDFTDKRVFDAGTATGLLAFEAEKKGASEVIAFDLAPTDEADRVPYTEQQLLQVLKHTLPELNEERKQGLIKVNNSFWFCHKALRSKVKKCYGNIYQIPQGIGLVDISILGAILLHMRNPLNALEQTAKITKETMIVTDYCWPAVNKDLPVSMLIPTPIVPKSSIPLILDAWWMNSPGLISQFLKILGFTEIKTTYHRQYDELHRLSSPFFTVVGRRV
jgi:hypothetical protein